MRISLLIGSILLLIRCQSSDQGAIALRSKKDKGPALTTFSSDSNKVVQASLRFYADSTFQVRITSAEGSSVRDIEGRLAIADDHYQLFFPDTTARLNELITPVHSDASVVVYPDGSVALDKALTQLYVRGVLVTYDTTTQKR